MPQTWCGVVCLLAPNNASAQAFAKRVSQLYEVDLALATSDHAPVPLLDPTRPKLGLTVSLDRALRITRGDAQLIIVGTPGIGRVPSMPWLPVWPTTFDVDVWTALRGIHAAGKGKPDATWLGHRDAVLAALPGEVATTPTAVVDLSLGCDQLVKRIEVADGSVWIAKVPRSEPDKVATEVFCCAAARSAGLRTPATTPLAAGTALVQECIEGEPMYSVDGDFAGLDEAHVPAWYRDVNVAFGAALGTLHRACPAPQGFTTALVGAPTVYPSARAVYEADAGSADRSAIAERQVAFLQSKKGWSRGDAEHITATFVDHVLPALGTATAAVLTHGDAHPTNVIVTGRGDNDDVSAAAAATVSASRVVLIDWADGHYDAPEADFAPMYPDLHGTWRWDAMLRGYAAAAGRTPDELLVRAFAFTRLVWATNCDSPKHRAAMLGLVDSFRAA